ncbi:serine hydrolase domain-containing protein [Cucumibacter marinus]|uniref:serine hydrolase domain-containing protein n=1 Tax=Cucumibacter marinus TaxID=1121252 RepID=UPI000423AAA3|nr:serine hydrolase domain-containing protein [Cucumibacter marinus]
MQEKSPQAALEALVNRQAGRNGVHELAVSVYDGQSGQSAHAAAGTVGEALMTPDTPFFIASTTKLFATAIIMRLRKQGKLTLDDRIVDYFPKGALTGLHKLDGQDRTGEITIRHLLTHTSGIADYFEGKRADGTRFADAMLKGTDSSYSLEDVLEAVRDDLTPAFVPGQKGKALYSDTNFQLLGGIIERITNHSLAAVVDTHIAIPLGLKKTYLFTRDKALAHGNPLDLRNGSELIQVPRAMQSVRLDGGGVSTSTELLRFLRGFYSGEIFPTDYLPEMTGEWRSIFFPLEYGVGLMRFKLPWYFSPFRKVPTFWGHSGISGAFAYWCADRNIYIAGTLNQLANRSLPYRFLMQAYGKVASS